MNGLFDHENTHNRKESHHVCNIFNMLKKNEENKTMQVTRETIIGDILDMD